MQLRIKNPSGETQTVEVKAKITTSMNWAYRSGGGVQNDAIRHNENVRHLTRMRIVNLGDVGILRFPWFFFDVNDFHWLGGKIRKDRTLIVDLRGNQGGAVDTLKYFIGMFLDHDVKLFDRVDRKMTSAEIAKSEHHIYFPRKVIVLVDSESASAAEIFARVIQLEKRGTVIGDRTSGSVMEATDLYFSSSGVGYGAEVTVANVIMTDGESIEHRGVSPDEVLLPQPADLASGRDPVLAHAARQAGPRSRQRTLEESSVTSGRRSSGLLKTTFESRALPGDFAASAARFADNCCRNATKMTACNGPSHAVGHRHKTSKLDHS